MVLTFLAGMLCGAALLIAMIVITDRSFLDLISGRFVNTSAGKQGQSLEVKVQRRVAVGNDS